MRLRCGVIPSALFNGHHRICTSLNSDAGTMLVSIKALTTLSIMAWSSSRPSQLEHCAITAPVIVSNGLLHKAGPGIGGIGLGIGIFMAHDAALCISQSALHAGSTNFPIPTSTMHLSSQLVSHVTVCALALLVQRNDRAATTTTRVKRAKRNFTCLLPRVTQRSRTRP